MKHLFPIFLLVVCLSCKKSNDGSQNNLSLLPLEMGNKWVYLSTSFRPDGTIALETEFLWRVTNKIVLDGLDYYQVNERYYFAEASPDQINVHVPEPITRPYFKRTKQEEIFLQLGQECRLIIATTTAYPEKVVYEGYECLQNVYLEKDCQGVVKEETLYFKPGVGSIGFVRKERSHETGNMYTSVTCRLKSYSIR